MDHDRVESYIYHRLGLDRNEDMVSDNAHDRVAGMWRMYESGELEIPDDWQTPQSWHDAIDPNKGHPRYTGPDPKPEGGWSSLGSGAKFAAVAVVVLVLVAMLSFCSGFLAGTSGS